MKKLFTLILIFGLSTFLMGCNLFLPQTTAETTTSLPVITDEFIDINSVSEPQAIEMNKSYRLVADLDVSDLEWDPIGTFSDPFLGIFDGNGHTITGLTITDENNNMNGLFGYIEGDVMDLTLIDISYDYLTDSLTYAGGIAGFTQGDVKNCSVTGDITIENTAGNTFSGLLVGYSESDLSQTLEEFVPSEISGNQVSGTIDVIASQIAYVGGLIGKTYDTSVLENISDATITVDAQATNVPVYVGGLIGHNYGGALYPFADQVDNIYIYVQDNISTSTINLTDESANLYAGGFMGFNQKGYLRDNYSSTSIELTGTKTDANTVRIGGFLGENFESTVERIFVSAHIGASGFDATYETSLYVVGDFSEIDAEDIFLYVDDMTGTFTFEGDDVTLITVSQKGDLDFYIDSLGWTTEFINDFLG